MKSQVAVAAALALLSLLSAPVSAATSKVKMESDGGYSGIVVKIGEEVPEEKCQIVLENLKKLFEESSLGLYDALSKEAYFKSVVVVVPSKWRDTMCKTVIRSPRGEAPYRDADVAVTADHAVHGGAPHTRQSRGCDRPGDLISLPWSFLDDWEVTWERFGDPSRLFVGEWAKYRYGVFDETGFAGDPMYPNYFVHDERVLPTGSSNVPVEGLWVDSAGRPECDPREEVCHFRPFVSNNDKVNCSLGFLPFLPNVRTFCGSSDRGPFAPTKHNVLCGGRGAMEVIREHTDFKNRYRTGGEDSGAPLSQRPTITVVREPDPQYVLVMETSKALDAHGQWKWINKAAQKFIRYDLPLGSRLAIVTFANTSQIVHEVTEIRDEETRARLADSVPDKYHLSAGPTQNLLEGVQTAVQQVLGGDMGGAHLVLVTRGLQDALSITDEQTIEEYVKYYHIRVSAVLVPDSEAGYGSRQRLPLAFYDSIAQSSGGASRIVRGSSGRSIETYLGLIDAFSALVEGPESATAVHQNVIQMDGYASSSGRFTVDASLGRDTTFGVYVDDEDEHQIRAVTFTDSRGQVFGPYTSMSSAYDVINLKVINYPVGSAPPFDLDENLDTTWQYTVQWYPGGGSSVGGRRKKSAVVVTSKQRELGSGADSGGFEVEVWTSSDVASDIVTSSHPLAVFASVSARSRGDGRVGGPVVDAMVTVEVTVAAENGSSADVQILRLRDNGDGDPDITAGDGVYSRYLTSYPATGRYEFRVTVSDNNRRAYWVLPEGQAVAEEEDRQRRAMVPTSTTVNSAEEALSPPPSRWSTSRCCGSRTFPRGGAPDARRKLTGEFSRERRGPVVHVLQAPRPGQRDQMPPSRVADLKLKSADVADPSAGFVATWTAPGDDYGDGSVLGYKVVYSNRVSDLLNPTDSGSSYEILTEFRRPDLGGVQTSYQFRFPHYDSSYYVGLVAFDEAGNEGKMSNLARVFLDSALLPPGGGGADGDGDPTHKPVSGGDGGDEGVMIGALIGTFVVIAVLLWAGIWYIRNHQGDGARRQRGRSGTKGVNATLVSNGHNGTANGSVDHDTSSSDLDVKSPFGGNLVAPQFSSIASGGAVGTYPGRGNRSASSNNNKDDDPDATPTYWSASQLLNEHEQRQMQQQMQQQQQPDQQQQLYSTTTYHNAMGPLPLDPIVEDPEDTYGISEMYNRHHLASRVQASLATTSTPIKYSTLTFPRNHHHHNGGVSRQAHSASPSPRDTTGLLLPPNGHHHSPYGPPGAGGGGPGDGLYGYAQSEPPNGVYGTIQRRNSGNRAPPAIPPKPSLSALMGLGDGGDGSQNGGGALLLADDAGGDATGLFRSASSDNVASASNGLTVRNVSQV